MSSGAVLGAFPLAAACVILASLCQVLFAAEPGESAGRLLIRGGTVYDGTGAKGVAADVLVENDTVVALGKSLKGGGAKVLDATGLAVCPGFIDVHNHTHEGSVRRPLTQDVEARKVTHAVWQGITTLVAGMDGWGGVDIAAYAREVSANPCSANIARLVGVAAVRYAVAGEEKRKVTPEELEKMAALVEEGMKNGAFGLSSGLEYVGDYVTTEEVIACMKPASAHGGYYETHLRNEDVGVFDATREAIRICREAGGATLSISHIKVGSYEVWHQADKLQEVIDKGRAEGLTIYSNWRPSINWQSDLKSFDADGTRDLAKIDAEIRKYWPNATAYCFASPSHPEIAGKTLYKIAAEWTLTPAEALVRTWDYGDVRFEFDAKTWEDKKLLLADAFCMVSSDGADPSPRRPDPLIWNCFPIFFGRMVREWNWMPVETAVYKCTGLPAKMLGLKDRGTLKPGMKADIVVFDAKEINGEEHWDKADRPPQGIAYTIVNGVVVMDHGKHTGALPGVFLRKNAV